MPLAASGPTDGAVDTLPPRYREPMILFYFREQSVAAVASDLRLPEGTVKARLSRGRDMLKTKLTALSQAPRG